MNNTIQVLQMLKKRFPLLPFWFPDHQMFQGIQMKYLLDKHNQKTR